MRDIPISVGEGGNLNLKNTLMDKQLIELLGKPKQKITVLVLGGGFMGGDAVWPVVTRGVLPGRSGDVLCCAKPRSSKLQDLGRVLDDKPCIVLRGHDNEKFLEVQTSRFVLDGRGGRMVDPANSKDNLLRRIRDRLICHTLDKAREVTLQHREWGAPFQNDDQPDESILGFLRDGLPPAVAIGLAPAAPAPRPRVRLLTDKMKDELLRAGPDNVRPLYKIFMPDGAATWLLCGLAEDRDTLWAVCDLGLGCVEYGTVLLSELETIRSRRGVHCERDRHFDRCDYTLAELLDMDSIPCSLRKEVAV
jgi:hypothetical protein